MANTLEINGKTLLSIKEASNAVSYSRDYITKLARENKIVASHVGRQWFVDIDSLRGYSESSTLELEIRKKRLSEERKLEQKMEIVKSSKQKLDDRAKTIHMRATVATVFILMFGLMAGGSGYFILSKDYPATMQVANTSESSVSKSDIIIPTIEAEVVEEVKVPEVEVLATKEISPIGENINEGVLLLPQGSLTQSAEDLFSDEVVILTTKDGLQTVVKVDENGVPTGQVIPFVKVPVSEKETEI